MDAALALLTIAAMLTLAVIAALLLTHMFKTIRDLRGITTGLNDTMRWAVGQVSAAEHPAIRSRAVDGAAAGATPLDRG